MLDKHHYRAILEIEMFLLMRYKVDAWTMEQHMSMMDLQGMFQMLTNKLEEERKQQQQNQTGDKMLKALIQIRDILNYMTFNETPR